MSEIWKTAYEIMRFTNYSFLNYDDHNHIVWLKNEKGQSVMLISGGMLSPERRELLTDNIVDRQESFSELAGFNIKSVRVYYETAEPFKEKTKNDNLKVTHKGLNSYSGLVSHPFFRLEMNQKKKKTENQYAKKVMSGHPLETHLNRYTPMTFLLLAINLVIFLVNIFQLNILGSMTLVDNLALSYQGVVNGDYHRLLTSTFLHNGMEHFLFNMTALFVLGKFVESLYGKWRLLITYVLTGVFSGIFSLMFLTDTVSLGASGAIYGLLGVIVVHLLLNKKLSYKLLIQVALIFVVIAVFSSLFSNINHYAHIGGLIFGLLLALLYNPEKLSMKWYLAGWAACIIIALIPVLFINLAEANEEQAMDRGALSAIDNGEYEEALQMVNQSFSANAETGVTYFALASLYEQAGEKEKAEEYYDLSFQLDPKNEIIAKHRLMELRKNRQYEDMRAVVNQLDGDVNDPELQLIVEELNDIEE